MIKRILLVVLGVLILLIAILFYNTFQFESKQLAIKTLPAPPLPGEAVEHLQEAIRHKTISYDNPAFFDSSQFLGFRKFLETTYPNVHSKLRREIIKDYSLLYTWSGTDQSLKPIVLMAHQDVVPIEEASR